MELTTAARHYRATPHPPPPCSGSFTSFSLAPCLPWSPEPSHHASRRTELTLNCVFKLCWIWHAGEELGDKDHGQKSLALQPFLLISPAGDSHESKNVYITVSSQICYPLRLLSVRGEVTTVWMFREQQNSFFHKSVPLPVFPVTEWSHSSHSGQSLESSVSGSLVLFTYNFYVLFAKFYLRHSHS